MWPLAPPPEVRGHTARRRKSVVWNIATTGNIIGEAASTVRGVNIQLTQSGRTISVALSRHIAVDSVTAATVNATTVNADTVNADTVNVKNLKAKGSTIFGGAGTSVTIVNGHLRSKLCPIPRVE